MDFRFSTGALMVRDGGTGGGGMDTIGESSTGGEAAALVTPRLIDFPWGGGGGGRSASGDGGDGGDDDDKDDGEATVGRT